MSIIASDSGSPFPLSLACPQDLEAYVSRYSGHTKMHRLDWLSQRCPSLAPECFKVALALLRQGNNTAMYREMCARASGLLGSEYAADKEWIEQVGAFRACRRAEYDKNAQAWHRRPRRTFLGIDSDTQPHFPTIRMLLSMSMCRHGLRRELRPQFAACALGFGALSWADVRTCRPWSCEMTRWRPRGRQSRSSVSELGAIVPALLNGDDVEQARVGRQTAPWPAFYMWARASQGRVDSSCE